MKVISEKAAAKLSIFEASGTGKLLLSVEINGNQRKSAEGQVETVIDISTDELDLLDKFIGRLNSLVKCFEAK